MRAVVQRVTEAAVTAEGRTVGAVGAGMMVLLGVERGDGPDDALYMAGKLAGLRIFADGQGRMNRGIEESGGGILLVSQFTLAGDARRGRRPDFTGAAEPAEAEALYLRVAALLRERGIPVETGRFGAMMRIPMVCDGPVTLLLSSRKVF